MVFKGLFYLLLFIILPYEVENGKYKAIQEEVCCMSFAIEDVYGKKQSIH